MREALTVIGFLLILALAAIFAAPLYVDWNDWRTTIAARLSEDLGTPVRISGRVEARLLPQPWLSVSDVSVGDEGGTTRLDVVAVSGDVSLTGLMRGDIELSNVVLSSPSLTLQAAPDGSVAPLTKGTSRARAASIESFEVQDGAVRYVNAGTAQDLRIEGVHLVGEARSLIGPYKAEGGLELAGVRHTARLTTSAIEAGSMKVKATFVPADRPLTVDIEGVVKAENHHPLFEGMATVARPALGARGDKAPPEEPWAVAARVKLSASEMAAESIAIQIGPDDRALKFSGAASAEFGSGRRMDATLTATQLELDRLAGVTPDRRIPPLDVLSRIREAVPSLGSLEIPARIGVTAQAVMLGSNLIENVKADLASTGAGWRIGSLEAGLPGQTRFALAGDVDPAGNDVLRGSFTLASRQASTLMNWIRGDDRAAAPNAARNLTFEARVAAGPDSISFSGLRLAVDDANVEGHLAWTRLPTPSLSGRVEADLRARRFDIDALPAVAALLPGGAGALAEADIKLSAQSIAFAGVEAKSASGRIRAGGKLVVLEDVAVDDLGGASLKANGRIDMVGTSPTGEIRLGVDARDLDGLATAMRKSPLPPAFLEAFSARAAALSPASVDIVASFGDSRRLAMNGKLGGTVAELALELAEPEGRPEITGQLRADSLDLVRLLKQFGLSPAPVTIPGRASAVARLSGPLDGPREWTAAFSGAGVEISASGKATGALDSSSMDGQFEASASDVLTPAQLFGVSVPGAVVGDTARAEGRFRISGGRLVFDDIVGEALDVPVSGDLAFDPGKPARVEGHLAFRELDAMRFAGLLSGSDLTGALAASSVWSGDAFGPATFDGLVGAVSLTADTLTLSPLMPPLRDVHAVLDLQQGSVSIDGLGAKLASGRIDGSLQLSRSAIETALTGRLSLTGVALDTPEIAGRLDSALEFQGTGRTPASLAASLTGGGALTLHGPRFGDLSGEAFRAAVEAVDGGMPPQIARLRPLFEGKLKEGPLAADDFTGTLAFAGGVARLATATTKAGEFGLSVAASIDLATLTAKIDLILAPPAPGDGLGGRPPSIPVIAAGKADNLNRQVDLSSLTAWLTVRAAEREAKKLEALEAERLEREKALQEQRRIEAERIRRAIEEQERLVREKAERERAAAEEKAARERVAAEAKAERERVAAEARAERERVAAERERAAAEAKAAAERAAREKAERDRAERERAARERAEREKAQGARQRESRGAVDGAVDGAADPASPPSSGSAPQGQSQPAATQPPLADRGTVPASDPDGNPPPPSPRPDAAASTDRPAQAGGTRRNEPAATTEPASGTPGTSTPPAGGTPPRPRVRVPASSLF